MNYEEKYKELAGKIKKAYLYAQTDSTKAVLEDILPELKESDDERIRKELIEFVKSRGGFKQEYITWLEKLKVFSEHGDGLYYFRNNGFTYVGNPTCDNVSWLEKQGENKPFDYENVNIRQRYFAPKSALEVIKEEKVDNANKVEPKFKVGDWVIDKQGIIHQIANVVENVANHTYGYDIVGGGYFNDNTEGVRLWTLADAKDGDVLISQYNKPFIYNGNHDYDYVGSYCGISTADMFIVATEKCYWTENANIHPATKEQRDTLFVRMKEAGYEWNEEKKELKKMI